MSSNLPVIDLLNCKIHAVSMDETVAYIDDCIKVNTKIQHVVVNAAKLIYMKRNTMLRESVVSCDIINADGQSLVIAAKFLGKYLPERVAGIDLMERLIELSAKNGYKVYLFGASKEVVEQVVAKYISKYGPQILAGYCDGYYESSDEMAIAERIGESGAKILFVAMSSPKKEIFLAKFKNILNIPFTMGVGGSFDVVAGKTKRAPMWMQKYCLEWLYRVLQEPGRMWKRYLVTNTLFIVAILKEKFHLKKAL